MFVPDYNRPAVPLEGFGALPSNNLGPDGKCKFWPPATPYDFEDMHPAFRPVLARLVNRINELGLPFEVNRGRRTLDRQCCSIAAGGSQLKYPGSSAHIWGLAVDFKGKGSRFGSPLSLGLSKDRRTITNSYRFGMWTALGALIKDEFPELEWGGDWGKESGQYLGWDPYHVELKAYRQYRPASFKDWKCVDGRAVKITDPLEKAKAAAEIAASEQPALFSLPVLAVGGVLAYYLLRKR